MMCSSDRRVLSASAGGGALAPTQVLTRPDLAEPLRSHESRHVQGGVAVDGGAPSD